MRVFVSFPGFYESTLSDGIDMAIEYEAEYREGDDEPTWYGSDFAVDFDAIAGAYLDEYAWELKNRYDVAINLKFIAVHSPREYNFDTDHLEAELPDSDFLKLIDAVKAAGLWSGFAQYVKDVLAPRSGFIPFYSNDLSKWGGPLTWELPQTEVFFDFILNYSEIELDGAIFTENVGLKEAA